MNLVSGKWNWMLLWNNVKIGERNSMKISRFVFSGIKNIRMDSWQPPKDPLIFLLGKVQDYVIWELQNDYNNCIQSCGIISIFSFHTGKTYTIWFPIDEIFNGRNFSEFVRIFHLRYIWILDVTIFSKDFDINQLFCRMSALLPSKSYKKVYSYRNPWRIMYFPSIKTAFGTFFKTKIPWDM